MERKPSIDGMSNWLSGSEVQAGRLEEAQKAQQEDGPAPVFLPKAVREAPQLGRPTQWQWIAYHSQMLGSWSTKSTTEVQTVSAEPCSSAAEGSESARASYLLTAWPFPYLVHARFGLRVSSHSLCSAREWKSMRKVIREEKQVDYTSPSTQTQS